MTKLYILSWILLAATALVSVLTGTFNELRLVAFSLIALALVYTLAVWSVVDGTREL